MERLIEKMMVDLDADSDEDSSYVLTNIIGTESDVSKSVESEQDSSQNASNTEVNTTFPLSTNETVTQVPNDVAEEQQQQKEQQRSQTDEAHTQMAEDIVIPESVVTKPTSNKVETSKFLENEKCTMSKIEPRPEQKMANGRPVNMNSTIRKKGRSFKQEPNKSPVKITPDFFKNAQGKENNRQ